jgi:hypothetical protein
VPPHAARSSKIGPTRILRGNVAVPREPVQFHSGAGV